MSRISAGVTALAIIGALASLSAGAAQRVFVASYGSDANTATNCSFATPCRGFTAAMTVVDPGGEVVALDAAGYGAVTITKSVTLTANPGFYAGIAASSGSAVTIATAGVGVTLRGLNINGIGATTGVSMTNGARLSIENCIISNFFDGITVNAAANVRVLDSIVRDNANYGVQLMGGASGDVASSKVLGSGFIGVVAEGDVASTTSTVVVTDSLVAGGAFGVAARSVGTGQTRASMIRTTVSNNSVTGVLASSGSGASAILTMSSSLVVRNGCGVYSAGTGAVLETPSNNTLRQNTTDNCGATSGGVIAAVSAF